MGHVPPQGQARREGRDVDAQEGRRRVRQGRDGRRAGRAMPDQRHHRPQRWPRSPPATTCGAPTRAARKAAARRRKRAPRRPPFQPPQLATLVDAVPTGPDWLFEYKYDGYRLLLATGGGAATAWTRNGNDWSDKFRGLVKAASALPAGCLIDGEAVALGQGRQARLRPAPGDAQGRRRRPCLLRLRPARRPGRGHHRAAQHRAQAAARGAAQGGVRRRSSTATMSSPRARPCSTPSARKAARGSSPRRPRRPTAARGRRTGSRSNASRARNSSSSAGRRATSGAASARSTSRCATARS